MGAQRRSATSTLTARLVGAVEQETREAALARWGAPPDVFVWRARRCAEAVLYAVLAREGADVDGLAKQRKGLDQLLEHKQLESALSRETRAQLASLREFGNIAAHYQLQGGVSRDSADAVAKLLAGLLREFHGLDGDAVPDAQRPLLAALADAAHRVRTVVEEERDEARRQLAAADVACFADRARPLVAT